jgi:hypothetical protein
MLGPEDAPTAFGLMPAEAQTLKELEAWAATQSTNNIAARTPAKLPSPADPAPESTKPSPVIAPAPPAMESSASPTTSPAYAPLQPAVKRLTDAIAQRDDRTFRDVSIRKSIPLLLRAGYVKEAKRLLELFPEPFDRIGSSGQVTAYLPGGAASADGQAYLRFRSDQSLTFWIGYAQGCAWRGDPEGIQTALARSKTDSSVLEAALDVMPAEALLAKAESVNAQSLAPELMRAFGKSAVLLGTPERATALLDNLSKAPAPPRQKPQDWEKSLSKAADDCRSGMAVGWAQRGEFEKARRDPGQYNKDRVEQEIAAYQARHGDLEGLKKTIAPLRNKFMLDVLPVFIYASKGDTAGAIQELKKSRLSADKTGWGYGLLAHAQLQSGDSASAERTVDQGLLAIDQTTLGDKANAVLLLIRGAVMGPEANPTLN